MSKKITTACCSLTTHQCHVFGCKNEGTHSFPKKEDLRKQWELATRCKDQPKKDSKICLAHFKPKDLIKIGNDSGKRYTVRILKKGAVPSIFSWTKKKDKKSRKSRECPEASVTPKLKFSLNEVSANELNHDIPLLSNIAVNQAKPMSSQQSDSEVTTDPAPSTSNSLTHLHERPQTSIQQQTDTHIHQTQIQDHYDHFAKMIVDKIRNINHLKVRDECMNRVNNVVEQFSLCHEVLTEMINDSTQETIISGSFEEPETTYLLKIEKQGLMSPENNDPAIENQETSEKHLVSLTNNIYSFDNTSMVKDPTEQNIYEPFLKYCNYCKFKCITGTELVRHIKLHNEAIKFVCDICNNIYESKTGLRLHLAKHTKRKSLSCLNCDYKTNSLKYLKYHIKTHTGDIPLRCEICDFKCSYKGTLIKHLRRHDTFKTFKCRICDLKYSRECDMIRHLRAHRDDNPFMCKICNFKGFSKYALTRHLKVHWFSLR